MSRGVQQRSVYFAPDEARAIDLIADREERRPTKIVQFAVRVFQQLYEEDPAKAIEMAQRPTNGKR